LDIAAGPGQPARSFLDPSLCFLCEQSLTALQHATRIVDTALDYWEKNPQWARLSGRKYVCEGCAHHVALALGYVTGPEHRILIEENAALAQRLAEQEKLVDLSGAIQDAIDKALAAATPTATAGKDTHE
jgi:hypothetical protein